VLDECHYMNDSPSAAQSGRNSIIIHRCALCALGHRGTPPAHRKLDRSGAWPHHPVVMMPSPPVPLPSAFACQGGHPCSTTRTPASQLQGVGASKRRARKARVQNHPAGGRPCLRVPNARAHIAAHLFSSSAARACDKPCADLAVICLVSEAEACGDSTAALTAFVLPRLRRCGRGRPPTRSGGDCLTPRRSAGPWEELDSERFQQVGQLCLHETLAPHHMPRAPR